MEDSGMQWENLPPDLIVSIVGRVALPDIARARGVCRHWAQVLRRNLRSSVFKPSTFPFLLLSNEHGESSESCTFLSLPERRSYRISSLPQIRNRRFIGSNGNWVVTLNPTLEPRLLNPFTCEEVPLPSLIAIPDPQYKQLCVHQSSISTWIGFYYPSNHDQAEQPPIPYPINLFRDLCIRKIVPSSDNGPPCVVVVAYGLTTVRLAFAKPGDCAWTLVPNPPSMNAELSDVIYNAGDGRFYAVTKSAAVLAFHPNNHEHVTIICKGNRHSSRDMMYLVFSSEDLLLVHRRRPSCDMNYSWDDTSSSTDKYLRDVCTRMFFVFKIIMKKEVGDLAFSFWRRLHHLNERCLMLGSNHSVSLSPEYVPGLKGNCIYFTDDYPDNLSLNYRDHPRDVGIFDMELSAFDRFLTDYSSYTWPPPIWFLPSVHMY